MGDGRRLAVTAGRMGLFVVAVGTAWAAITTAAGGHGLGAVLVAAPVVPAPNARPASSAIAAAPVRPEVLVPVSRDRVRTPLRTPAQSPSGARRHVAR
jgi:hypothetical protein